MHHLLVDKRSKTQKSEPHSDVWLCFPGWATTHRIFDHFDAAKIGVRQTPEDAVAWEAVAKDLVALDPPSYCVVGFSQGAYYAQAFALAYPDRVGQLVLVGARPGYPTDEIDQVDASLRSNPNGFLSRFYRHGLGTAPTQHPLWTVLNDDKKAFQSDYLSQTLCQLKTQTLNLEALAALPAQVTFIHGHQDAIAPVDEIQNAVSPYPGIQLKIFPEEGHFVDFNHLKTT